MTHDLKALVEQLKWPESYADHVEAVRKAADALLWAAQEIRRLEIKTTNSLANNLCPDHRDKQQGKPCLACEIERLKAPPKVQQYCTHCGQYSSICQGGC